MIEVDNRKVLTLFANLNSKKQKKVYKQALTKANSVLVKETKKELKRYIKKLNTIHNPNKGKPYSLQKGIKGFTWKNAEGATINILGDFRLKFFEKGTNPRYVLKRNGKPLKKKAYRGRNKDWYYFSTARRNKEKEIFDNINKYISDSINKIANK